MEDRNKNVHSYREDKPNQTGGKLMTLTLETVLNLHDTNTWTISGIRNRKHRALKTGDVYTASVLHQALFILRHRIEQPL